MCFLENKVIPNSLYESILYALVKFILQVTGYSFCLKYCFPFFFFKYNFLQEDYCIFQWIIPTVTALPDKWET